jgi:hypothetical protein
MNREKLIQNVVDYHILFMPTRELLDTYSDDHLEGDIPMRNILRRAYLNMEKHYKGMSTEALEALWADIGGSPLGPDGPRSS